MANMIYILSNQNITISMMDNMSNTRNKYLSLYLYISIKKKWNITRNTSR